MNKLTSIFVFSATLLLAGCSHSVAQTQVKTSSVPVAVPQETVASTPAPSAPVDQTDDEPQPHQSPFTGKTWSLTGISPNWIGLESADGAGLLAVNPSEGAKVIMVSKPSELSLPLFATQVKKNLLGHGVKFTGQKNVKINGVSGVQFTTSQNELRVIITLINSKTTSYLFGCGSLAENKAAIKTCSDVRDGLHFTE